MAQMIARTESRDYPVYIQNNLIDRLGESLAARFGGKKILVATDENVAPHYLSRVLRSLYGAGIRTASWEMPAGEVSKNMHQLNRLYTALFMAGIGRSDGILALGGGVVGDLAGFAAATYMRGVELIHVPTSLMAQLDSSLGGKNGVDMPFGKNMVGSFYQPHAVFMDPACLRTLPREERNNGMAEAIKYACIGDVQLFEYLEKYSLDLEWMMQRCVAQKLEIVQGDEKDKADRQRLNFGHSFGHAIERITNYEIYRHGEAVAIGMYLAARVSEYLELCPAGTSERLRALIEGYKLPWSCDVLEPEEMFEAMKADKKRSGDKIRLILLREIGEAFVYPVELKLLPHLIEQALS